jgi:predicted DCC family thiol-disulfide oxidoreductase YuxK
MSNAPKSVPEPEGLTVLYDGACPLCSREIAWYRRRPAAQPVTWIDLSRCADADLPEGIGRDAALARFHVVEADGRKATGAAAFARLWACYPRLRGLARLARLPGVARVLEWGYRAFLRLRPRMARLLPPPHGRKGDPP